MFLVLVGGQLTVNLSAGYLQRGLLVGVGLSSPAVSLGCGMLLTYHYRHKCSGSTFRVAGAAASVSDFTLVADDLALAGWKLFLAASLFWA